MMFRMFANDPGDLGSIPGRDIPKTKEMVLDAALLKTQHYKVRLKGKVKKPTEKSSALPYIWCSSNRKGSFGSPTTKFANFTYLYSFKYSRQIHLPRK